MSKRQNLGFNFKSGMRVGDLTEQLKKSGNDEPVEDQPIERPAKKIRGNGGDADNTTDK